MFRDLIFLQADMNDNDASDDIQQTMFIQKAILSPSLRRVILISSLFSPISVRCVYVFFSIYANSYWYETSL